MFDYILQKGLWGLGLMVLIISTIGFTAIYFLDQYQWERYTPDYDSMSCEELKEWIIEKRINGNGYEMQLAEKYSDVYPVRCD